MPSNKELLNYNKNLLTTQKYNKELQLSLKKRVLPLENMQEASKTIFSAGTLKGAQVIKDVVSMPLAH